MLDVSVDVVVEGAEGLSQGGRFGMVDLGQWDGEPGVEDDDADAATGQGITLGAGEAVDEPNQTQSQVIWLEPQLALPGSPAIKTRRCLSVKPLAASSVEQRRRSGS